MRKLGQHNVDRVFDESLVDVQMPVSNKVWANISSELEKDGLRRKVFWYRSVAVASVVLLIGLGAWVLAWQGNAAQANAPMAAGKSLKPWHLTFGERPCMPTTTEKIASTQNEALRNTQRTAQARNTPIHKAGTQGRMRTQLTVTPEGVQPPLSDPATFSKRLDEAQKGLDGLRKSLQTRSPRILPSLSDRGNRPTGSLDMQGPAAFPSLITAVSPEKKREKEFTYVLEDNDKPAKPTRHWELGAGFSPDMTFASTTPVQQFNNARSSQIIADDPAKANTNRLSPVIAYASAVRASFELNDRLSVRSGLTYVDRQSSTTEAVSSYGKVAAYESTLNLMSLEVPLSMRYNVIKHKNFDYFVSSGVSGTFLLHFDNTQVTTSGKIAARRSSDASDLLRPSQGSLLLSTGMRCRIFDRLNLQVEPGMRYGILTNEYAFSQSRPVSMSLMTGLNYRF
jgi:hypothetical protein